MKLLRELLPIDSDLMIYSIHADSRDVMPNSIFFCIDGLTVDGHEFVSEAIMHGAKVIVHSKPLEKQEGIIYYQDDHVIELMAHVANHFYDFPSKKLKITGITGTVGKTTVATLVYEASKKLLKMGYIGTHLVEYNDYRKIYHYTTPEYIFLQDTLANMVEEGTEGCVLEVSSHGLSLKRVEGIEFDIAVFTNLMPDHLDFHSTMENYENAKLSLFTSLSPEATAIIDINEPFSTRIKEATKAKIMTYGIDTPCDVCAKNLHLYYDHSSFDILYHDNAYHMDLPLIGSVNINHTLAAIAVLIKYDIPIEKIIEIFQQTQQIEGHYEVISNKHQLNIIVDEGYTPSHYLQLFEFIHSMKSHGRIIAVFGCVGKKELSKREKIGQLANKYCDYVILTEEDPRGEDVDTICKMIQKKITDIPSVIIDNRELAIYQAIEAANPGDTVLLIGKGKNKYMIRDVEEYYVGDKQVVLNALNEVYTDYDDEDYEE